MPYKCPYCSTPVHSPMCPLHDVPCRLIRSEDTGCYSSGRSESPGFWIFFIAIAGAIVTIIISISPGVLMLAAIAHLSHDDGVLTWGTTLWMSSLVSVAMFFGIWFSIGRKWGVTFVIYGLLTVFALGAIVCVRQTHRPVYDKLWDRLTK